MHNKQVNPRIYNMMTGVQAMKDIETVWGIEKEGSSEEVSFKQKIKWHTKILERKWDEGSWCISVLS